MLDFPTHHTYLTDSAGERVSIERAKAGKVDLSQYDDKERGNFLFNWWFMAREEQLLPAGDWSFWLYMAGRGAGKTRTGAETTRELVKRGYKRIGLIAPTASDARDVMVEGESGILAICPEWDCDYKDKKMGIPRYEPSKRRVTWANGAIATLYSADEPERLRGPQHEFIWADELASWRYPETWDLAMFGLRLGKNPRAFISTTPKPKKILKDILNNPSTIITRGTTYDNRANLAKQFFKQVVTKYEGTRLGQQELQGQLLEESEEALWDRRLLDQTRLSGIPDGLHFTTIVVAIDPAVSSTENSDETGIIVMGLGDNGHEYVLADFSGNFTPLEWATAAIRAYNVWQADFIVAEKNQGGDMITEVLSHVDSKPPVKLVHASRGKRARAEPVAARFEKGEAHLIGFHPELEDQLCTWEPLSGDQSPDRLDAMVWASKALGTGSMQEIRVKGLY